MHSFWLSKTQKPGPEALIVETLVLQLRYAQSLEGHRGGFFTLACKEIQKAKDSLQLGIVDKHHGTNVAEIDADVANDGHHRCAIPIPDLVGSLFHVDVHWRNILPRATTKTRTTTY